MIQAKIIADSVAPSGIRLTTFVLTYPRFIHSEFLTHRMFSRNASSSRAIPVKKQIDMVITECAIPLAFTKNQKGMQGGEPLSGDAHDKAVSIWLQARDSMVIFARQLADLEVHKQYANRLLEPFAYITVNGQYYLNKPMNMLNGAWHLPFVSEQDILDMAEKYPEPSMGWPLLVKRSVARCARVSYLNHDGTQTTIEQDLQLYDRLLSGNPIHASPAEHQAMAIGDPNTRSGNFYGWIQYRKTLPNENIKNFEK